MQKRYSFLFVVLFSLCLCSHSQAQALLELGGISPVSLKPNSAITGGGVSFGFYSSPVNFIKPSKQNKNSPLCMRFGGHLYYDFAGHKKFNNIPLLSPGQGVATADFSNSLLGLNASAKLSSTLFQGGILPYAEVFAGLRYYSSDLSIQPYDTDIKSSSQNITHLSGLNVGATGGLLFKIADGFYIDAGIMYTYSALNGEYVDLKSLQQIGTSIGYKTNPLPNDFLIFKLGFTGYVTTWDRNGKRDGSFWDHFFDGCNRSRGGGNNTIGLFKL